MILVKNKNLVVERWERRTDLLVYGFQRSRDRQVILEFDRDALICERFEDREYELCAG